MEILFIIIHILIQLLWLHKCYLNLNRVCVCVCEEKTECMSVMGVKSTFNSVHMAAEAPASSWLQNMPAAATLNGLLDK